MKIIYIGQFRTINACVNNTYIKVENGVPFETQDNIGASLISTGQYKEVIDEVQDVQNVLNVQPEPVAEPEPEMEKKTKKRKKKTESTEEKGDES